MRGPLLSGRPTRARRPLRSLPPTATRLTWRRVLLPAASRYFSSPTLTPPSQKARPSTSSASRRWPAARVRPSTSSSTPPTTARTGLRTPRRRWRPLIRPRRKPRTSPPPMPVRRGRLPTSRIYRYGFVTPRAGTSASRTWRSSLTTRPPRLRLPSHRPPA